MARPAVKALEFRNLAVTVPMSASAAERKRAALRTKALVRHATMHTLQHKPTLVHKITKGAATRLGLKTSDDVEVHAPPRSLSQDDGHAADFVASLHETGDPNSWSVLKDCSGVALAGELVGILGPSGCGKTTLLGAIAGSSLDLGTTATLKGEILVDGMPRIGRQVAYVPQADPLIPTLTVQECVRYSALLRLPRDTPAGEINARVEGVLGELGLTHVADSQVGGSGRIRGISGGERRRVTIAMELVTDPSIIVLDEPTSGLDSFNCSRLLRSLRHVAAGGRVVLASLHQPSHDMFFALDRVILMGHGRMLFAGRPEEAEGALAAAGVPCPNGAAVAEHMLKVASSPGDLMAVLQAHKAILGYGGVDGAATSRLEVLDENERSSNKIALNSQESPLARPSLVPGSRPSSASDSQRSISTPQSPEASLHFANGSKSVPTGLKSFSPPELDLQPVEGAMLADSMQASTAPGAGFTRQLAILFWRTAIDIFRNPTLLLLHVTIAACVGVLIGAIFFDLETSSIGVQNRMGGTFFALAFLAFTSLTTVDLLMNERAVVVREVRSGYYSPTSYLLAKLALDGMLLRVIPAIMFWLPFYYMAGLRTGAAYAATYAFALQAFNCAIGALSMAVTVASATAGQSSFIMNFLLLFSLAFAGFLVNVNSIPAALRWIHYLSPFYFAFEAMTTSELNGQSFTFKYQASPDAPVIEVPDITGETFLASLGFNTSNTTLDLAILVAMYAGFVLLALALFLSKLPRTKRTQSALGDEEKMGAATSKVSPMRGSTARDNPRRTI
jgi:ABC-type multidrug transport system ATPase subunit